jgi:hypothetical protein
LRILAAEFREARLIRAEEKAARLPAMLTVPMILFILPTLFIMVLGPAGLSIADTFSKKGSSTPATSSTSTGARPASDPGVAEIVVTAKTDAPVKTTDVVPPEASVMPVRSTVAVGDLVVVDIDARALRSGSMHRVAMLPNGASDAGETDLSRIGLPIAPDMVRLSLPARVAGDNEIRLYYTPKASSSPIVAARASVTVTSTN